MMLDINLLKTFVTLAEYKHFGKAANALHMTQPNVSLHLKQLEQQTRIKLIERSPFQLTQAGERLLETSQRTLLELQICQADLNAINDLKIGTLTIAVSDIISRFLLIRPFQKFKAQYPGIDLTLLNTTSSQASNLVKNAQADIGFVIAKEQHNESLYFTKLQELSWCALGDGVDIRDSDAELTLILLGHDTRTRDFIDEGLPSLNLPNYRVMEVGSVDAQIDWAEAGFGVAIVPEFAVSTKQHLHSKVTPLTNFSSTSLGYIVRQNQVLSKATKQLLGWVNDEIISLQNK
ncbi:LysR family transcriptional regulator [Vibrio sp. 10N.286.52.C3]|jgi:DNA-binding transcriptional LysR family regulator|uniref:LysR family transcriptional regulator n=1 Tax=Vibrio TaxID=662 RepID=UPI0003046CC2|nr:MULTISPECIES: LysR family transcriptional regulator [Vibrio]OED71113.1 LysR family transcriptional regulator [Vibrio crassostreae ZF-91]OEE91700.1 LysR family transcriptional regulator [Vibrio crassostreae 9ZC88]PMK09223.1 LysR family transcriptional regulator [Vibrio sp. 10N.261.54.E10]PMN95919.1 LysR family transcriptional regulator [Vibrio sp. 10N.222.55.F9]TKF98244.1 LysR family transcriptional regulator [Vibrio sp. F13]